VEKKLRIHKKILNAGIPVMGHLTPPININLEPIPFGPKKRKKQIN
jgi:hypothetical protein